MNEKDLYTQLKNAFLLGNYFKVFEFLKTIKLDDLDNMLYRDEIASVIVRSAVVLNERKTPEIQATIDQNETLKSSQEIFEPFLNILQQVSYFFLLKTGKWLKIQKKLKNAKKIAKNVKISFFLLKFDREMKLKSRKPLWNWARL